MMQRFRTGGIINPGRIVRIAEGECIMFVSKEGVVSGSVNRAQLVALHDEAEDDEVRANLAVAGLEHGMYIDEDGYLVDPSAEPPADVVEPSDEDPEPTRPAQADPKADWVDWAVSQGADRDEAEALTKVELIEFYGGTT